MNLRLLGLAGCFLFFQIPVSGQDENRSDRGRETRERGGERNQGDGRAAREHRERGRPEGPEAMEKKIHHLNEAAEHLELAGLVDESHRFRELAARMHGELQRHRQEYGRMEEFQRQLRQLHEAVQALREENQKLRTELGKKGGE